MCKKDSTYLVNHTRVAADSAARLPIRIVKGR